MQKKELPLAVCSEAFPTDPDFPQLKIATDPALMLEVFREHLKPISRRALEILECIPFRFRCRQSTARCVLQYTLRVAEPGAQRQWDQWVTGLVYAQPGEAERLWQEAQGSDLRQEVPGYWLNFEPVCFIPDLQMLVTLFPYDRKLRSLDQASGGPTNTKSNRPAIGQRWVLRSNALCRPVMRSRAEAKRGVGTSRSIGTITARKLSNCCGPLECGGKRSATPLWIYLRQPSSPSRSLHLRIPKRCRASLAAALQNAGALKPILTPWSGPLP